MSKWRDREIILDLIEQYKNMPFLWDKDHKDYKNQFIRNGGKKVLLEVYKAIDSKATMKDLTKKIDNLRSTYRVEFRKAQKLNRKSAVYVPTLWYYDALSFLQENTNESHLLSRPSDQDPIQTEDVATSASESENESSSPPMKKRASSPVQKRAIKSTLMQKQETLVNTASNTAEKIQMKEEKWEIIGKSIGLQLKDLDKRQSFIAQKIIHDTLYYAQMEQLTENSSVTGVGHVGSQHNVPSGSSRYKRTYKRSLHSSPIRKQDTQSDSASSSPKYYYVNSSSFADAPHAP